MKTTKYGCTFFFVLALLVWFVPRSAAALVIDSFDDPAFGGSISTSTVSFTTWTGGGIFGGSRDVVVTANEVMHIASFNSGNTGWFGHFPQIAINGTTRIIWDGDGDTFSTLPEILTVDAFSSPVDLTQAGTQDALLIDVIQSVGPIDVDFWVHQSNGGVYTGAINLPSAILGDVFTLSYSSFTLDSGSGTLDFSQVDAIEMEVFNNIAGIGLILDHVETTSVPEPTTMLLLGIGLVGLAGASVRRRIGKRVRLEA